VHARDCNILSFSFQLTVGDLLGNQKKKVAKQMVKMATNP